MEQSGTTSQRQVALLAAGEVGSTNRASTLPQRSRP